MTPEPTIGLTTSDAQSRLAAVGPNLPVETEVSFARRLLARFWGPVPWMLEVAILLQIALREYVEAGVIAGLLVFNAILALMQEGRAAGALAALKRRLAPTALVCRDGVWVERPAAELVPGDVIRLYLGALVPADGHILSGDVVVDQSMLTGEALPVDAAAGQTVFAGALVCGGEATAEVTATGARSYFGRAAELVRIAHVAGTEQRAIRAVARNLAVVNGAVAAGIIAYAWAIGLTEMDLLGLTLTAVLASIPIALPATFTLSAAIGAQRLAANGVLLTRLSALHEVAAMDMLCADKTGTLTRNELRVDQIVPFDGFTAARVLRLAALASSEAGRDPLDAAIRAAATAADPTWGRVLRLTPFDPAVRIAQAVIATPENDTLTIVKGAFAAIETMAKIPAGARERVDALGARGHRAIAIAAGPPGALRLAGLIAISDTPREDSAALIMALRDLGVRTIMVTGDSPSTAVQIAARVGIASALCPPEVLAAQSDLDAYAVFARVLPAEKYQLVQSLQRHGHVVGMCGDGVNDAPALRQAHVGIAVASATDVAKAAAAMVMTEPGLGGIVRAVREGRAAFQRLLSYTLNMVTKKTEIVLFLAVGLVLTGAPVMTPVLMVLLMLTNDFLSMSLTMDRARPAEAPSVWRMSRITASGVTMGACKLLFSVGVLAYGTLWLRLGIGELRTLAFVTLVFGNQATLYALRERRHMWSSRPGWWVILSSLADVALAVTLASAGLLMTPLAWPVILGVLAAAAGLAFVLDQVKLHILARLGVE